MEGYCILAERLRSQEERDFIRRTIEKHCGCVLDPLRYYDSFSTQVLESHLKTFPHYIQMNQSFKRMAVLVLKCYLQREPALLIGETGCGKTTLSQLLAHVNQQPFFSLNCH